jgi:hypothetical protein
MSNFTIPNKDGRIRQVNRGDIFGEIVASFNIDLSTSHGKIKTSKKLGRILTYAQLGNGQVQDIIQENNNRFVITSTNVYESDVDDDPTDDTKWAQEAAVTDTFTVYDGLSTVFDGKTLIAKNQDIASLTASGGTYDDDYWTNTLSGTGLSAGSWASPLHVHRGGQETLIVGDVSTIRYYNATAGHSSIALDDTVRILGFASGVSAVWCGTLASKGEHAFIYEFYIGEQIDGTPVARNAYKLNCRAAFSIAVHENTPYIINELGELQRFNGVGFTTVAELPFASENIRLYGVKPSTIYPPNNRPVHPNGMKVYGNSIYIYINNRLDSSTSNPANWKSPAGIWEYNIETGTLNHRHSPAFSSADYGRGKLIAVGPLYIDGSNESFFLLGAGLASASESGLFGYSDETPAGYFVTSEIAAGSTTETFEKLVVKAKTPASGEKIVFKYRTENDPDFPQYNDITWTAATTFTTTDASFSNVAVGNEIEVVDGYGAGHLAHITVISEDAGTYTVTIDESIGSNTETAEIRVDNWIKLDDNYTATDKEYKNIGLGMTAPWIQFKVYMVGNIEIRSLLVKGNTRERA